MKNRRDYLEWFNYHAACLSSVQSWFDNLANADAVHAAWERALSDVGLEDACSATDAVVAGRIDRPFPEETPAMVRRHAANLQMARQRPQDAPGFAPSSQCGLCSGYGLVTIWAVLCVRGAMRGTEVFESPSGAQYRVFDEHGQLKRTTEAVACKCSQGDKHAYRMRNKGGGHWEREYVGRLGESPWHCKVVWRTHDEIKAMTHRERVLADCQVQGVKGYTVTEWDVPDVEDEEVGGYAVPRFEIKRP